ncbi:spaetzle domain-containing protein [Caerostris extrusa]|uniref:Spaetzle domain-containing protein n=1 Tax=Caerostris extrusa TaxID=172846 RepID=A0AAV4W809_CAEEX|nr:spaetzle domain-containing protein [Caerostris extrusa]
MGTSFLQEVSDTDPPKPKSEASTYSVKPSSADRATAVREVLDATTTTIATTTTEASIPKKMMVSKSSPIFDRCHGNQYLLRTPYHMYNVKGELRYIVQDPPHLEQCYLEATCSIPSDVCRNYGYGVSRRGRQGASPATVITPLLAWDPSAPDGGTFFDIFEYSCCCNCHTAVPPQQSSRPQIIG